MGTFWKLLVTLFFLSSVAAVFLTPFWLVEHKLRAISYSLGSGLIYLLILDGVFRLVVRIARGRPYQMRDKIPFKKMYVEPHPYLPYVLKKKFLIQHKQPTNYPLDLESKYHIGQYYTNNLRHVNGPDGSRDVVIPKPQGMFRINCLGGSTTQNYIQQGGEAFSYPMELEEILKNRFPEKNIEVNNCGMGGFSTAEVLIKFLLNSIDSKPDMVILYHAYNDLAPSLTSDFQSDYFHAKRNLGERYHLYKWASLVPYIPLALPNYLMNIFLPQNVRQTLLSATAKGTIDLNNEFKGLETYRRNIEHLIHICKGNEISLVFSTFCHFLYPEIENNLHHLKYREGTLDENRVLEELADKHDLPLVDNFNLVSCEKKYFVDSVHFSPEGMREVAKNLSKPIIAHLDSMGSNIL